MENVTQLLVAMQALSADMQARVSSDPQRAPLRG